MSFLGELKRRNVIRVAAAYVVASWLIIQVVETLFPVFGLSDAAIRAVVIVLAVGLVPVMVISWAFELTPDGLKLDKDVARDGESGTQSSKTLDRVIMLVLALAVGYFAFDKFVLDPARDADYVAEVTEDLRSEALLESYGERSIAVLPFVDMSRDGDQEYMSDGIAEELLNLLAKIPELRVVSRSSAFAFKGKDINIPEVASKLNVAYVLEGSVRLAGDQLRITAQLIEAATDTHLWSETYDRKLDNVFEIQDEISAAVVDELRITLLSDLPRSRQIDEQAYRMALQARYFWNRRAEGDADAALKLYQQAIELEPDYAAAWAGLAIAYVDRTSKGFFPRDEGFELARQAAETAYALDPNLADAQIRMGQIWSWTGEHEKAAKAYERALELEPNNPTALSVMAQRHLQRGELDKGIALYEQAEAADPMGALWPGSLGRLYINQGRFEAAEAATTRAYEIRGDLSTYLVDLSYLYLMQRRYDDVMSIFEDQPEAWEVEGFYLIRAYLHMAVAKYAVGEYAAAEELAQKMDAMDDRYESLTFAAMYAMQGRLDEAFENLPNGSKFATRQEIEMDPHFESLRDDPRWEAALQDFAMAD